VPRSAPLTRQEAEPADDHTSQPTGADVSPRPIRPLRSGYTVQRLQVGPTQRATPRRRLVMLVIAAAYQRLAEHTAAREQKHLYP
jgi:hypothetical protein